MNREEQIKEFMKELEKLWLEHPQQRFGQLLFNYTQFGTRAGLGIVRDPFHYQDEELLKQLKGGHENDE